MKATTSNNDGFTLVELMVVVVILGIFVFQKDSLGRKFALSADNDAVAKGPKHHGQR